jgi:hypothetical protein
VDRRQAGMTGSAISNGGMRSIPHEPPLAAPGDEGASICAPTTSF